MTETTPEETQARRALKCLFIAVDEAVARDVNRDVLVWVRAAVEAETHRCVRAVETRFRAEEHKLEEKNRLIGGAVERVGQAIKTPLIRESADIAACRLMAIAAIRAPADEIT